LIQKLDYNIPHNKKCSSQSPSLLGRDLGRGRSSHSPLREEGVGVRRQSTILLRKKQKHIGTHRLPVKHTNHIGYLAAVVGSMVNYLVKGLPERH